MKVTILSLILALSLSGCVAGSATKPLTLIETQLIAQVVTKRLIAYKLSPAQKINVIQGVLAARAALDTTSPQLLLDNLGNYLGPENKDIADLMVVLIKERVDLSQLPEVQGKEYLKSMLAGIAGGLE
jgi:hypothetical protein